jgi:exosortase/archaeosortase family protein
METIFNREKIQKTQITTLKPVQRFSLAISLLLPLIYVVVSKYFGLDSLIAGFAIQNNVPAAELLPLSLEYLVFTILFILIISLMHGSENLMDFSLSIFFLASIGVLYAVDDLHPYGQFTPFQALVPTTATLAAKVLNLMGYHTQIQFTNDPIHGSLPTLITWDPQGGTYTTFSIAWPCAGVESLLIYTMTLLLFFKKTVIPWKQRALYFVIGAATTYLVNISRVVAVFVISLNGGDVWTFHNFYGWLFSITWIVVYPFIIIGIRNNWKRTTDSD